MNKQIIIDYKEYLDLIKKIEELKKLCNDLYRTVDKKTRKDFAPRMDGNYDWL